MNEGVAYWAPPDENPNFISRPPDPGVFSTLKTAGWEALYHSPFYATKRFSELSLESSDYFNVAGRILDPAEATQKYGLGGQLKFDEPIKEEAAQLMYRRKMDENDRAYLISSGQTTGMRQAGSFAVSMAATLIDPINFASMFIPVAGEARIARFASQFGPLRTITAKTASGAVSMSVGSAAGSVLKERLAKGALMGATGAAMVEPFVLLPSIQEQANYDLKDSAMNLGFGAALGGMLHAGLGAIGDRLKKLKPKDADVIFESAMNNVLKDESVTAPARVAEFVDELHPEQIQSAAVRLEDGTILTGKHHPEIFEKFTPEQAAQFEGGKAVDGFVTDQGRFVDRGEAMEIAHAGGQVNERGIERGLLQQGIDPEEHGLNPKDSFLTQEMLDGSRSGPTLDDIPRRDAKGKFLSKEKRLEMLDQKLREEGIQKQENGDQKVIKDTKEISSREPQNDLGMTGDHAKDITSLEQDTAEIEKALDLTPEEATRLREDIKAEAGDQPGRAKGIVEGIKCIIKNLV